MSDKFKKIDKYYKLSSSSLNSYKYRLLTSGYLMQEFAKNPIGYYLHGTKEHPREVGVLVKWEDLKIEGDIVYGKPCINLTHPRGQRTVDEIESGFLNAASVGSIVVLEVSSNPADYVEGQDGPTVTKWYNRECSLVDVPGNYDALTDLYDADNNPLKLSDLIAKQNFLLMKQYTLNAAQLAALNLKAEDSNEVFNTALQNLIAKAQKVDTLTSDLAAANTAKKTAEDALTDLKATTVTNTVNDLVAKGIADKKLTAQLGENLKKDYATNPDGLKALVDAMPAFASVIPASTGGGDTKLAALIAKSWKELDEQGQLEDLKAGDFEAFKTKFKEEFKKEYEGK